MLHKPRSSIHPAWLIALAGLLIPASDARFAEAQVRLQVNPYEGVQWDQVKQHKANLHTHTTQSDGRLAPDVAIDEYRSRGYTVLALSDHDKCTFPWSEYGRVPDDVGMVAIPGNELSRHHHTLSLFCKYVTDTRDWRAAIAGVGQAGGVAVIAHPAMHWPHTQRPVPALQVSLSSPLCRLTQGDFTLEAWFRTTDSGRNILMGNFDADRDGALNLELHTDNRVRIYLAPAGRGRTVDLNVAADALDIHTRDGRWHHLAAVRRGQRVSLYLDGRLAGECPDTAQSFDLPGDVFCIGRDMRTGSTTFQGDLDDVRLWRRALNPQEIASLTQGNLPGQNNGPSANGLLAQYTFDQFANTELDGRKSVSGRVEDSANHPEGPFPAEVAGGAPLIITEVPKALQRSTALQAALRFAVVREQPTGVPDHVVEQYAELYTSYPHLLGQEVLNGTRPMTEYPLDRELWDKLLTRLMPVRPVWGFAHDDMHGMTHLGRDWISVLTPTLSEESVRDAMTRGAFFFSSTRLRETADQSVEATPVIERVDCDTNNGTITVEATERGKPLAAAAYQWIADGKTVHVGPRLNYRMTPGIVAYVRAEITGSGGTSFTNPFGFRPR